MRQLKRLEAYLLVFAFVTVFVAFIFWSPALARLPNGREFHVFAFPGRVSRSVLPGEPGPGSGLNRVVFRVIELNGSSVFYIDLDDRGSVINCRACRVEGGIINPALYQAIYDRSINGYKLKQISK